MIIMSFGSGLNMESKSPLYIKEVAASVAYAHSKNISIGGETTGLPPSLFVVAVSLLLLSSWFDSEALFGG